MPSSERIRKLIKMRSVDNPHLPQDFIERLEANYDPSLLQAYLHGEFVNLNTGQVYDRFDRSKHVTSIIPDVSSNLYASALTSTLATCRPLSVSVLATSSC